MTKQISIAIILYVLFLNPTIIYAQGSKYVEIFDPKQDKVVKVIHLNAEINNMISGWVKNIDGIYAKNDPITNDGYAIKVPLDPKVTVRGKWLNATVKEVYIIIPETDPPFFMIFENENKLSCFLFDGSIDTLSKILGFKLQNG